MKKFNYFDDVEYLPKSSKLRAAEEIAKKIAAPIIKKLKNVKKRVQGGEALAKIISGALAKRKKFVRISAAAICVLFFASAICIPAAVISKSTKKENIFRRDAGAVCSNLISEYGVGRAQKITEASGDSYYALTGLSYVRQLDFDSDSSYELLAVYESGGEYFIEVWGYVKGEFAKVFSFPANTAESEGTGAWISLYNNRGKYYIGLLSDDGVTMQLYTKSGNKFKSKKECRYDAENNIYAIDDKIDERDFETVRLSYISDAKAQYTIDFVSSVIEQLAVSDVTSAQGAGDLSKNELYALYAETVSSLEAEYGEAGYEQTSGVCSAFGVCTVRLIDFNNDKTPEMLVVFSYDKRELSTAANGDSITVTQPAYKLRVYAKKNSDVKMIYETDALTAFQGSDTEQFYILQTSAGRTNLCTNTYSYSSSSTNVWKATSRIRQMSDNLKFETVFTAVANCSWGYMSYSIDGDVVYSNEFSERGYRVPYFCTHSADYDEEEFTVSFVRGGASYADEVKSAVDETKAQIKELNAAK